MHRVAFSATLAYLLVGPVAAQDRASQLSIERIFAKGDFVSAPLPDPHWLADGASYVEVRAVDGGGTDLVRVDVPTGKVTVIAPAGALVGADGKRLEVEDITLSADERKALLLQPSHNIIPVSQCVYAAAGRVRLRDVGPSTRALVAP